MRSEIRGGGSGRGGSDVVLGGVDGTKGACGACFEMGDETFVAKDVTTRRSERTARRGQTNGTVVDGSKRRHDEGKVKGEKKAKSEEELEKCVFCNNAK